MAPAVFPPSSTPTSILLPPLPPSSKSARGAVQIHSPSKILAFPGSCTRPDSTLSEFDSALASSFSYAHPSRDDSDQNEEHDILWDHFGFIPSHPDLLLDGYKPLSPLSSPSNLPANLPLPRTSPSSLPNMAKKRRSLQAILVPSFLPQPAASSSALSAPPARARSHTVTSPSDLSAVEYSPDWLSFYAGTSSPRSELSSIGPVTPSRNSPPPDLLDEDPFANLSPAPSVRGSRATSPVRSVFDVFSDGPEASPVPPPRSPLAQSAALPEEGGRVLRHAASYSSFHSLADGAGPLPSTPPPTPIEPSRPLLRRPKSSGPPQVRPAYTRPAFAPRPSLPSLNTLAQTSIHVPQVRRGRPGAHLPLEPWEDADPAPAPTPSPPSPTRSVSVPSSPIAFSRRRPHGHSRRPTLSVIRDSRMFLDGESAEDDGIAPLEPEEKEPLVSGDRDVATPTPIPVTVPQLGDLEREDIGMGTSFLSISPETYRGGSFEGDLDQPPTPPPKSPSLTWHARSASETSATSTCTVPSLCPSSPTSSESFEGQQVIQTPLRNTEHQPETELPRPEPRVLSRSHTSPLPSSFSSPRPPHPRPHDEHAQPNSDCSGLPSSYPTAFAQQRHTQFLTSDLIASLEYDYSEALTRLSTAAATGLTVPLAPSGLFPPASPSVDFEPGSSAGTIRNIARARDTNEQPQHKERIVSDGSADSQWSIEAHDAHHVSPTPNSLRVPPLSPLSPPELPSSSPEVSADSSPTQSPLLSSHVHGLSRSSSTSSSAVSSEYDFGDDAALYYSYDLGAFADPLGSPPAERRAVFGYGIPWPSTHRTSAVSTGSGGSGGSGGSWSGGSMSDVLSDLEYLAEDLTERFSLSTSAASFARAGSSASESASEYDFEGDVFNDDGRGALMDAPEGDHGSSGRRSGRPSGGSTQGYGSSSNGHSSSYGYGYSIGARRASADRNGRGDDEDEDDGRKRRPARLPLDARTPDSDTSDEDSDSGESDYGEASPRPHHRQRHDTTRPGMVAPAKSPTPAAHPEASPEDDVPLARQIPTALRAQRTIRRQVRDELDQKRQERRAQRAQRALLSQQQQSQQASQHQPARALSSAVEPAFAPPRPPAAAPSAPTGSSPPRPAGRPRTKTLPSTMGSPFSVGDLTKKLLGLQTPSSNSTAPVPAPPAPQSVVSPMYPRSKRPSLDAHDLSPPQPHGSQSAGTSVRGRTMTVDAHTYTGTSASASVSRQASRPPQADGGARTLRPMRSFHRPRTGDADAFVPPALPSAPVDRGTSDLQRRGTTASRHRAHGEEPHAFLATVPPPPTAPVPSTSALDRARSVRSAKSAKSSSSRRPSLEKAQQPAPETLSRTRAPTASVTQAPASTFSQPAKSAGQMMWQQRVFIGNMQRFCTVEIGTGTSAGDVLGMVDAQGALEQGAGSGGWMLWEVSQDFGMERPIRSFEMLSDVCGSWNTDKTVNLLVIKKTLLAPLLSPKAMPSASPTCSGYVQWEYKRGKWQKRWMELREHSLWLSKRDTGKDATFLCSLNNFDAYYVTRVHKAPKPYVFSVKSTDSLTFFENTADYVHVFSCGEGEGKNWLEKILLARSYVLYQERNVLSSTAVTNTAPTASGLQRAGTRRQAPAQPLISVGAPKADPMSIPTSFEPAAGSLLARRHV